MQEMGLRAFLSAHLNLEWVGWQRQCSSVRVQGSAPSQCVSGQGHQGHPVPWSSEPSEADLSLLMVQPSS